MTDADEISGTQCVVCWAALLAAGLAVLSVVAGAAATSIGPGALIAYSRDAAGRGHFVSGLMAAVLLSTTALMLQRRPGVVRAVFLTGLCAVSVLLGLSTLGSHGFGSMDAPLGAGAVLSQVARLFDGGVVAGSAVACAGMGLLIRAMASGSRGCYTPAAAAGAAGGTER
jgi:hypothetical protein